MEASRQHNTIAGYKDGIATPADKPGTKQYGAPPGIGKTPNLAGASMAKAAPTTMDEAFEGVTGLGNPTQADAVPAGPMTAASFSATGMGTQYSEQERAQMAKTLAGELGPKTLQGILEGNPEAVAEANAMLGTIDNRVNSITGQKKANPVSGTLVGKQYNANLAKNQKVTLGNYKTFGPALLGVVDDYTKGLTASPAPNATNYVNKSIANPSWSKDATQPVGLHSFGTPFNPGQKLSTKAFGAKTGPVAAIGLGSEPGPITPDAGTAGNALKGTLGVGGGYVSDVGQSGVKTSSPSVNSPGGETGFGRDQGVRGSQGTGLGGRVGSGSFGSKSPAGMGISDAARGGLSGNNSPRGTGVSSPASTGSRVGTGAFGGGYADSSSGAGTKSSPSGISAGSNSPRGMGNQSLGGSSSPSKSGSGSASSASSGNSRGGLSSGRGMGGFN
jgi:hypothetical protein